MFSGVSKGISGMKWVNEPTHILAESLSCIDLLFTSDQDLVMEPGVH